MLEWAVYLLTAILQCLATSSHWKGELVELVLQPFHLNKNGTVMHLFQAKEYETEATAKLSAKKVQKTIQKMSGVIGSHSSDLMVVMKLCLPSCVSCFFS